MRGAKRRGATRPDCYATDTAWLEATLPTYALRLKAEALGRVVPEPVALLGVQQGAGGEALGESQVCR